MFKYGHFSGPYFPAFGLNTKRYSVSLRIQSKCGKMHTRKTPYLDTFHTAFSLEKLEPFIKLESSNTYRERYSTHQVLIRLVEILKKLLDQMFIAGMVLIDLSKRLDCISYELFIAKLYAYGFSQDLVTFI